MPLPPQIPGHLTPRAPLFPKSLPAFPLTLVPVQLGVSKGLPAFQVPFPRHSPGLGPALPTPIPVLDVPKRATGQQRSEQYQTCAELSHAESP